MVLADSRLLWRSSPIEVYASWFIHGLMLAARSRPSENSRDRQLVTVGATTTLAGLSCLPLQTFQSCEPPLRAGIFFNAIASELNLFDTNAGFLCHFTHPGLLSFYQR